MAGFIVFCGIALQAAGGEVPEGFVLERVADGITGATALAVAPDGRVFVAEQTGALRVVKNGALLAEPFVALKVDSYWERGLIGVALHPGFPEEPYVYVTAVLAEPYPHHRVLRFTAGGDAAVPGSERVLLEGDDQTRLGGSKPAGHQGGALRFGADGKLYVAIGDQTAGAPAQRLDTFQGKLLRINPDGSIPEDNPFFSKAQGKYRAIWALGLRNPFAFAVQPGTGRMYINDVGDAGWEEINEGAPGANYGWPKSEGYVKDPAFRGPVHAYPHGVGKSITGGVFYHPPRAHFPAAYAGKYFFLDYEAGWLKTLDPAQPLAAATFARRLPRPVDVAVGPDGALYVLNRSAWVKDEKFKPGTGSLVRIRYSPGAPGAAPRAAPPSAEAINPRLKLPAAPEAAPRLLSETGAFASTRALSPAKDALPYDVLSPLWSDGASKSRWLILPPGGRIAFRPKGEWTFPAGTVFVKHFERGGRRLETRLLVLPPGGEAYGITYKWRDDQSDAELLPDALRDGGWYYPSRADCMTCHTPVSGYVLGVKTRQLSADRLRDWSGRGLFQPAPRPEEIPRYERLAALDDEKAPLEARVRSYLDSNCSGCHRPGGSRSPLDTRFDTPLAGQDMLGAAPVAGDLETPGARIVTPGEPARSILYERMKRRDLFKMPPLASDLPDDAALRQLAEWISALPRK